MMIPETENAQSWPPVVVVAVAAVALGGGALYYSLPLESQRPSNPSTVLEAPRYPQFPLARLWQDPLHVVHEHWDTVDDSLRDSVPSVTRDRGFMPARLYRIREADDDRRVLRLLVMLSGMPYSDDRERRRRQRHAVVSALTAAGFVPSDGTRLRYFRAPSLRHAVSSEGKAINQSNDQTLVGYETYEPEVEPRPKHWAAVEVFWLNTEYFLEHPLHKVSALVATLDHSRRPESQESQESQESDESTTVRKATTVLLGPPSSGVLKKMFEENPDEMPPVVQNFLEEVAVKAGNSESLKSSAQKKRTALHVFSSQATIPVEWLVCRRDDDECPATDSLSRPSRPPGVKSFHSAITDDGRILKAVLTELVNRGACTGREQPKVVIVSEQDTVYGRLLGDLAEHAAERVGGEKCKFQIVEHGYLQGVDGEMPPPRLPSIRPAGRNEDRTRRYEPLQENADAAGGGRAVPSSPSARFEQPFGAAQLDYVRRLSGRLASDAPPVAIGVLGNDLYDKLLVLQALRESHPGVVFFTTDMDARLLDPAVNRWTRNLIVGSAYGLSPEPASDTSRDSYRATDIFRDSYQVALFVAVQDALNRRHPVAQEPKLFEISSRAGFVPLGSQTPDRNTTEVMVLLTPLAALAVFALVMYGRQKGETADVRRQQYLYIFVAVLATAAAAWLYVFVQALPNKEPGPLFDGVSTVPMVMLQITSIVFAVAILCLANGRMRDTLSHVADRLGGTEPKHGLPALRAAFGEWRSWNDASGRSSAPWRLSAMLVSAWKRDIAGRIKGSERDAAKLWSDVLRYSGWWPRFARIGAGLLVGLALRELYFHNVRIQQPLLGQAETTPGWMTQTYVLPVVLFWAISYCRDTVRTWQAFIRALGRVDVIGGRMDRDGDMKCKAAARARWSMDLLVYCTNVIGPVVVLPLTLMVLLMLARSTLFDGWNWTVPLIVFHVGLSVYILFIAVGFQREASQARDAVLDRLREAKLVAKDADSSTEIENIREYIRSRRDGAFVPWTQHPILQTLTLPLGSFALITLLERLIGR